MIKKDIQSQILASTHMHTHVSTQNTRMGMAGELIDAKLSLLIKPENKKSTQAKELLGSSWLPLTLFLKRVGWVVFICLIPFNEQHCGVSTN